MIERLKPLGIKIAVISNGSLLWRADVREALADADWVSVKVDAVRPDVWRRINRPHRSLWLSAVLEGMLTFAEAYRGELVTETMLVRGVNDDAAHLADVACVPGAVAARQGLSGRADAAAGRAVGRTAVGGCDQPGIPTAAAPGLNMWSC